MTRKDYIVLAAALSRALPAEPVDAIALFTWRTTVRSIADALQADNPRFDRRRFYAAADYKVDPSPAFSTI
jgi:hypothetical protein